MRIVYIILFLVVSQAITAQQKNFIDKQYIEITGTAEKEITPNEIYLKTVLSEKESSGRSTLEEQQQTLLSKLKSVGVDIETEVTVNKLIGTYEEYFLAKDRVLRQMEIGIMVCDVETLNKVFKILKSLKVRSASVIDVGHSEMEKLNRQTKVEAIKAAKEKATQLTDALGQQLGKALHIIEVSNSIETQHLANTYTNASSTRYKLSKELTAVYGFKPITIRASFQVKFELL